MGALKIYKNYIYIYMNKNIFCYNQSINNKGSKYILWLFNDIISNFIIKLIFLIVKRQ